MKPYYQDDWCTIYHGDCREILPSLPKVDLVLTDPPYPSYLTEEYKYYDGILNYPLLNYAALIPQIVFWTPAAAFPLSWDGMFCWDKATGTNTQFELVYFRKLSKGYKVLRHYRHNNDLNAKWCSDLHWGHPSQKPIKLIHDLLGLIEAATILDPFMGSGTTLVAAKNLNRKSIGIEIEEKYCEIAAKRLSQEVFNFAER